MRVTETGTVTGSPVMPVTTWVADGVLVPVAADAGAVVPVGAVALLAKGVEVLPPRAFVLAAGGALVLAGAAGVVPGAVHALSRAMASHRIGESGCSSGSMTQIKHSG